LHRISRGIYSLSSIDKTYYSGADISLLRPLLHLVKAQLPYLSICVWRTNWLNAFMQHQPGKFMTILEVEKDGIEAVFHLLRDEKLHVFMNPTENILNYYVNHQSPKNPIILTRLISEAPVQVKDGVTIPTIEKILVDLLSDPVLYATFQGKELKRIYKSAFDRYQVNEAKVTRYASRRGKKTEIIKLLAITKKRQ